MVAAQKLPVHTQMSAEEFLAWNPQDGRLWQLIDGQPQAMAPAGVTHGAIQSELARCLGNHFVERGGRCRVITTPGVIPRVNADENVRIPDLAVSCAAFDAEEAVLVEPVLLVEILSPSNQPKTWINVWAYTTIPSVREILILKTEAIGAQLLRRNADGLWPESPIAIDEGELFLASVDFRVDIATLYRTTRLVLE